MTFIKKYIAPVMLATLMLGACSSSDSPTEVIEQNEVTHPEQPLESTASTENEDVLLNNSDASTTPSLPTVPEPSSDNSVELVTQETIDPESLLSGGE